MVSNIFLLQAGRSAKCLHLATAPLNFNKKAFFGFGRGSELIPAQRDGMHYEFVSSKSFFANNFVDDGHYRLLVQFNTLATPPKGGVCPSAYNYDNPPTRHGSRASIKKAAWRANWVVILGDYSEKKK